MSEQEKRLSCPVCERARMRKLRPSQDLELTLDYCDGCGGMWFETGEVRQLRLLPPEVLSGLITVKKQLFSVNCVKCGDAMTRNTAACKSCGRENVIDCPGCGTVLERIQSDRFTVDVCRDCRGVWFDNIDLSQVWNLQFGGEADGREADSLDRKVEDMDTVVAILRYSRDASGGGADGSGSVRGRGGVAGARQRRAGSAGPADRNVFGTIADIIGGIFSSD